MEVKSLKLDSITPYGKNAKKHDKRQINNVAESIKQYGFVQPIVVDRDGVIVIGHCRALAAKKLGMEEVPCVCVDDLTPEQVNALRLVDNKSNESDWDFDLLAVELPGLDLSAFDFDWGLRDELNHSVIEDDYDPVLPAEPKSKIGDVYQLGNHRLMCGDSTSLTDVQKLVGGMQMDLLLTDPPYNVDYKGTAGKIINDNMEDSAFRRFLTDAFSNAAMVMKPGAPFYIWHAETVGGAFRRATNEALGKVRQMLIWNKNAFTMGHQDYQWKHEACIYGWTDGGNHYFVDDRTQATVIEDKHIDINKLKKDEMRDLLREIFSDKVSTTVIDENKPAHNADHPTMKPLKLLARLIKNSSRQGDIVLDTFGGSGSTLITCEQLGRSCYTMELDPKYADVIVKRWLKFTGTDRAELVRDGKKRIVEANVF